MSKAIFAGSFNPFTIGHADIVGRGLEIFDDIYIAVGVNVAKADEDDAKSRVQAIQNLYLDNPRVHVVAYSGLTTDLAKKLGVTHLLRSVRNTTDFDYEHNLADINRRISGIDTVLLLARPELACISSSMVRELMHFGHDVSQFLPSASK